MGGSKNEGPLISPNIIYSPSYRRPHIGIPDFLRPPDLEYGPFAVLRRLQDDGRRSILYLKKKFVYSETTGKFERFRGPITILE